MPSATSNWPPPIFPLPLKRRRMGSTNRRWWSSRRTPKASRITQAIRDGLKAKGKLGKERIVTAWVPTHLTDAQKADATEYEPGDLVQFQQNAPGQEGIAADRGR